MTKWLIASDIHGSDRYCQELMRAYSRESPSRMILLGDLLYHGPRNDLPEDYAPKEVISMLNSISPSPLCVRGNCEAEVDQMVLSFPVMADYALLPVGERLAYITHGHLASPDAPPPLRAGDILLSGHTHIPAWDERDGLAFLNPGSVSLPKENSPRGYMTLEGTRFTWKTLDGAIYHELILD